MRHLCQPPLQPQQPPNFSGATTLVPSSGQMQQQAAENNPAAGQRAPNAQQQPAGGNLNTAGNQPSHQTIPHMPPASQQASVPQPQLPQLISVPPSTAQPQIPQPQSASKYLGKFDRFSADKYDEFLKELGVNTRLRKAATPSNFEVRLKRVV